MDSKDYKEDKNSIIRDSKSNDSSYKITSNSYDNDDLGGDEKENDNDFPKIQIINIGIQPNTICNINDPLELRITFELDRDVVAAYWIVKFLVDSTDKRVIRILGETQVEDYPDGESEMIFSVDTIDISGISPSVLTNSGLLMAEFIVDGIAIASVNMVINVQKSINGDIVREILNPLN